MSKKQFEESAVIIGEEMHKWDSVGAIYDSNGGFGYRLFCNGNSGEIALMLSYCIAHLCEAVDNKDYIDMIAQDAKNILAVREGGMKQ